MIDMKTDKKIDKKIEYEVHHRGLKLNFSPVWVHQSSIKYVKVSNYSTGFKQVFNGIILNALKHYSQASWFWKKEKI